MFCKNCGASLPDGSKFCAKCGSVVVSSANELPSVTPPFDNPKGLNCPNCKSKNLQAIIESDTSGTAGKGYSGTKGCLGLVLLGPLGLLCGNCGSKQATIKTTNKIFWMCRDCGTKFRDAEDLGQEKQQLMNEKQRAYKLGILAGVFFVFLALLFLVLDIISPRSMETYDTIGMLFFAIIGIYSIIASFKIKKDYEDLKAELGKNMSH